VLVVGRAGVDAMDVVYAATYGPFFDDAETHFF
jgi:acyl-CoA thioesterase FadM